MTSDHPPMTTAYRVGRSQSAHVYKHTPECPQGDRFACARYDEDGPLIAAALNAYTAAPQPSEFHEGECAECPGEHECPNPCWKCVAAHEDYLLAQIDKLKWRPRVNE